ncbi:MAG: hypothetical protein Q7S06_03745 [Nanoarchaeota archaeon]|nr:hypothetical protein [Nanoarchaeota archaeon]
MLPHEHLISAIIFSGIFFLISPSIGFLGVLLIILSAVLVDVDHYIFYAVKKRDLSLVNAYKWYQSNRVRTHHLSRKEKSKIYFGFHFLHGIEIFAIIYLLYAYVNPVFLYVMMGYSLHFFGDLLVEVVWCGKTDKISVIYSFFRMNKLKFVDDI